MRVEQPAKRRTADQNPTVDPRSRPRAPSAQPTAAGDQPRWRERLMTTTEVSEMLGIPVDTLYAWRHRGLGPRGYRVGRYVRYRPSAVESWLEEQADQWV